MENNYGLMADYHTHTVFSHGKGTILDNALEAKEKGLIELAITDHGFNHPAYGMRRRELAEMRNKCNEAEEKTGVKVYLGTEANILGVDGKTDVKEEDYDKLDIYLAGIHRFVLYDRFDEWFKLLGWNSITRKFKKEASPSLIKRTTMAYINCIKNNPIDILTHPGFLVFCDPIEVAKCCADYGTYFEINSKKGHLSDEEWEKVLDTDVEFIVSSDAHKPTNVGNIGYALSVINRVNIPRNRIVNLDGKLPIRFRFREFKGRI